MPHRHLDREIERLKKQILTLCAIVENSVQRAAQAVSERNERLARQVIDMDNEIDLMEVDVEEECLKLLALHQPVAIDLRFVIAVLKINNDLERIGDEAVNIAERALFLAHNERIDFPIDFALMSDKTQLMLQHSLDALMRMDVEIAREVGAADDEIDKLNAEMYLRVQEAMCRNPERIAHLQHVLSVARHLERIADYATNIAEDIIYMIDGDIVRHKAEAFR